MPRSPHNPDLTGHSMLAFAEYPTDSHLSAPAPTPAPANTARRLLGPAMRAGPRPIGRLETDFARTAWAYFDRRCDRCTGLAPMTGSGRKTTISAVGATLLAIASADLMGLLRTRIARDRVRLILRALQQLAPDNRGWPAAVFDCTTLQPAEEMAPVQGAALIRLIAGFIVCAHHYPTLAPEISEVLDGWTLAPLPFPRQPGKWMGGILRDDPYCSHVAALVGLPLTALGPGNRGHGNPIYLAPLEFGWRPDSARRAVALFLAERQRFTSEGRLTARGTDPARKDDDAVPPACLLTGAAFGWHAIFPTPYSTKLVDAVRPLARAQGWLTGRSEVSGKPNETLLLNTNAEILEALHYRARGPLLPAAT